MTDKRDTKFGIKELAAEGGVSRRTVRYYVQRGLLPPPTGTGRGNHYTQEHLDRLVQVRTWQEEGVTLAEIEERLRPADPEPAAEPAPVAVPDEVWRRFALRAGIELHVQTQTRLSEAETERILDSIRSILGGMK